MQVDKLPPDSRALAQIEQSDKLKGAADLYREPQRAQFHFSAQRGWLNDPNGMVYANGEYHLFFQHNPYGWNWGNMHWGHAVSRDMVHWQELPIALYPRSYGDDVFSGSAVVDRQNTSGWKPKNDRDDLMVAAYTSTGRGECIVYSDDRGRTWKEFFGNPVVKHNGRDPRLLWHAPTNSWVMAVYAEDPSQTDKNLRESIAFYTSPDLKTWTYTSRIGGFFECPDLFALPLDGDASKTKWILTGASSEYMVGTFDGKTFTPETTKLPGHRGRGFYAAQTFSHEPKNRTVQIGWFQVATPQMPANQAMSLPLHLTLHSTPDGPRMAWQPVPELNSLRAKSHRLGALTLQPGAANPLAKIDGELIELRADFEPGNASEVLWNVRGVVISYDVKAQELWVGDHHVPAPLRNGRQNLIVYIDRAGVEVFASDGLCYVPMPIIPDAKNRSLSVASTGAVKFQKLEVHELKSIWPTPRN